MIDLPNNPLPPIDLDSKKDISELVLLLYTNPKELKREITGFTNEGCVHLLHGIIDREINRQ